MGPAALRVDSDLVLGDYRVEQFIVIAADFEIAHRRPVREQKVHDRDAVEVYGAPVDVEPARIGEALISCLKPLIFTLFPLVARTAEQPV